MIWPHLSATGETSPSPRGSFELSESLNVSTSPQETKQPAVSRTPKSLSVRQLALSVSSVASADSVESSLRRSVTFSEQQGVRLESGSGSLAPGDDLPPEIPSDGEYSEDFDDGPIDSVLANSTSYAEDFEDSVGGTATSRSQAHGAPSLTLREVTEIGSNMHISNAGASDAAYSKDFEQSVSKSRQSIGSTIPREPASTEIDGLLGKLASESSLPAQVSEIRHGIMNISRALRRVGNHASKQLNDANANALVQIGLQLEWKLEQLEAELLSRERQRRLEVRAMQEEKRAARTRADLC